MTEPAAEVVNGRSQLPRLTSLRWYAALVVLLYHANASLGWRPLRPFESGQAGVSFFFVLSGFVLAWSYAPERTSQRQFWHRRFARIYPSHLVMTVIAVSIGATGIEPFINRPVGVLAALVLLQAWVPVGSVVYAANSPSWSLSCEAFFYALFPWIHAGVRRTRPAVLVLVTGVLLAATGLGLVWLGRHGLGYPLGYTNPVIRLPEFILGVVLAALMRAGVRSPVPTWVAGLFVVLSVVGAMRFSFPFLFLPAIVVLIVTAATADLADRSGPLTLRVSVWLGEVSFAFYLVHQVVLFVFVDVSKLRGPVGLVIVLALSLAAAALLHHLVELPTQRRLTRQRPVTLT